jgi:hypothetical protein
MPDGSISVKITAEASGFTAGVNQTADSVKKLETELAALQSQLAKTEAQVAAVTEGFSAQAKAAAETAAGVTAMRTEVSARQDTIAQINAEIAARKGLASAAAENAKANAEAIAGTRYYSEIPEQIDKATEAHDHLKVATAGTTREFLVLGHEAMTGNFNRIPGSIVVLLERMGSLHTLVSSLSGVWGVAGIAGAGALAAIGYAAYQAIEGVLALRDATDRLVQSGVGLQQARADASALTQVLSTEFRESGRQIKAISDEMRALPSDALGAQVGFARLGEALAGLEHSTAAEEVKKVVEAAKGGPEAYEKWAEKILDLRGALAENGELLSTQVKALTDAGRISEAFDLVTKAVEKGVAGQGEQYQKARTEFKAYLDIIGAAPDAMAAMVLTGQPIPPPPDKSKVGAQPTATDKEITAGLKSAAALAEEEARRLTLANQLNSLKTAQLALEGQIEGALMAGNNAAAQQLQRQLDVNRQAQQNIEVEAAKVHGAGDSEAHAARMAQLQGELEAQRNNAQAVIAIRRQIADEIVRYETEALAKVHAKAIAEREGIPAQQALPRARGEVAQQARNTPAALAAENQYQSAVRSLRETEFKTWIDQMREAEAQAERSGAQRIAIEEEVNAAIHAAAAEPEPRVNAAAVEAADRRLAEVKRQAEDQALQNTLRDLNEEAREHQKNADAVVAIETRKREAVRNLEIQRLQQQGKSPQEAADLADQTGPVIEQINAVKAAQQRAAEEHLQLEIATQRAIADETEAGSAERLATERKILEQIQEAQQKGLKSEQDVQAQKERVASAERAHSNEMIRLLDTEKSARLKALDEEITNARHNEALIEQLLRDRIKIIDEYIAKEKEARQAAGVRLSPEAQKIEELKGQGEHDDAAKRLDAQKQKYADEEARRAVQRLEAQRHVLDQQEQADLRSVDRQRQMGTVTAGAAAEAEARIVEAHSKADQQILQQELEKARGIEELETRIADTAIEAAQRDADKEREIQEKAEEERVKRAKEIDKEVASSLADAIMGVAEHKETWGQAIVKFIEQQEKKLLEKSLQKLFDQSGLGEMFGGLGDLFGFGESGSKDPNVALRTATVDQTSAMRANTAALLTFARQLQDRVAAAAGGTGTGTGATGPGTGTGGGGAAYAPATGPYADLINNAAAQYKIPPGILYNLIGAESGFNPNEATGDARGLAQFRPETAKEYGVDVNSPSSSIFGAAHYLSDLFAKMGSWAAALGAYSGQGPELATYGRQKNGYGPALVASAQQADRGEGGGAETAVAFAMQAQGLGASHNPDAANAILKQGGVDLDVKTQAWCAALVNAALEHAGIPGSGNNLASSFKTYGQAVAPGNVQRGDIFYSGAGGGGDTGHVGFALGPVENGRVQVMSSHTEGAASNAAGVETRSAAGLEFRRPEYAAAATELKEAATEHKEAATGHKGAAHALKDSAGQKKEAAGATGEQVPSDNSPYAKAVRADVAANGPMAGPAAPPTGEPIPIDIRAVAGSPLVLPGTTSGGGLPLSSAAPPSAAGAGPAVATPEFAEGGPVDKTGLALVHEGEYVLPAGTPHLAAGGTVKQSGAAQVHAGETIVPAQVVPIQTIQAGARQSQPGPGPVGQTTQTPWLSIIGSLAALAVLPKLLGGLGFGGKGQAGSDPDAVANTQATQQNTQATQQNTEAKQQGAPSSTAPVTSGEVGGTGVPGTGVDVGLLRAAASGSLGAAPASASAGGEGIPQFAKGGPVDQTGLAMLHAGEYVVPASAGGTIVSADDGDITGGSDSVEMVTNPLTGNQVPRFGADGADWSMASLAEWKEGPSGSLAQRAWSSVKGAGSWAWSFNPFNAKQFSAQSFSSNSVLGGMSFEQAQSLTPMSAFSALDVVGGGGPGGAAKAAMASLGGGEPGAPGASGGMMAWLNNLWSGSAQAAPAYAEGGVVSAARGTIVVPGEIAPVATQGAASPVLPKIPGLGKGWELWAAILALLMLLMGKGGQKKPDQKSVGTTTPGQGQTQAQPKSTATQGSGSSSAPSSAPSGAGGSGADPGNGFPSVGDRHDDTGPAAVLSGSPFNAAGVAGLPGTPSGPALDPAAIGNLFTSVADRHDEDTSMVTAFGAGDADSFCAGGIASAAGGLQVHETSLPQRIKSGVRDLAAKGKVGLFRTGRLTSAMRGAAVADGKGGQLAVVHPGELILPAPETSQVLSAMSSEGGAIVPSAAGGSVVALPEQQTVSSLGFQPITLQQANPSSNLGGLTQILALIMALQKLMGLFGGGGGGNTSPTGSGGQGGGLFGGILGLPQKLLGGLGNLFGGGTSGGGANSGVEGMVKAADQAAPALQGLTSSTTGASSGLTGFAGMLGSLLGGGGGGGGGGIGGIFGFIPKILGGLFALEGGGVIPSAAGGMMVGAGGSVADGKGGRLIIAHPQEMVLPARQARGLSNLLANFEPSAPSAGGLGRILSMRMMTPTIPHFAQGAWELDRDMVGMLHRGEQVIPSSYAEGLRAAGGGGASTSGPSITYGDTHVHLSAIDSRSGAQFLMAHSDTIAKSMFRAHRNNSRFTPGG